MAYLPLFPEAASTMAKDVDALFLFLVAVSGFFALLIAALVVYFSIRYRRRSRDERPEAIEGSLKLELLWTVIPFGLTLIMFVWGATLFVRLSKPPPDAIEVFVVGKQWMWKIQHLEGRREINELHVPVGRPIKLTMTSEDVIHSFYVPAFRIKQDVLPNRYTTTWFEATKPGRYHLFCAEYCGTEHSGMVGSIVVMEPSEYEEWLGGGGATDLTAGGAKLFEQLGCASCHRAGSGGRGPALEGLFGSEVALEGGQQVKADEDYVRESILNPRAKIVSGYKPIMPTFQGLVSQEGILQLVAYVKSLGDGGAGATPGAAGTSAPTPTPTPTPAE